MGDRRTKIKISVRNLVEFLLRSGDISKSTSAAGAQAMQEGTRIHRSIQSRMGASYRAEVSLKYTDEGEEFDLVIEGRADGIFDKKLSEEEALNAGIAEKTGETVVCIDEIKSMYRDVTRMNREIPVHLAQAKCYAAIWMIRNGLKYVGVQLTYCSIYSRKIKRFFCLYGAQELENWFLELVKQQRKWSDFSFGWRIQRQGSIHTTEFPYDYRPGQKELCVQVYSTVYHKKRLFLEAPTGVGKTISTLFPAVKALGEEKGEMIVYLTAKTITGKVAENAFDMMREGGLCIKTLRIMAKEKYCFLEEPECDPAVCEYAKGHYDRINDAIYDIICSENSFTRDSIRKCALGHRVCPYELCLELAAFADAVICDYNYVFDPNAALKRFFADNAKGDHIFLVDEAHNLVDRAREMYTATIYKDEVLGVRKLFAGVHKELAASLGRCNRMLLSYMRMQEDVVIHENIDPFLNELAKSRGYIEELLDDERGDLLTPEVMEFYFRIRHFTNIGQLLNEDYVIYSSMTDRDRFMLRLYCVNPSTNLRVCLDRGRAACFFSATLLPVTYYMDLISGDRSDYAVYAPSPFDSANRGVFVATDVSSRYKGRGPGTYALISEYIHEAVKIRSGKYMVFFPSYSFLESVYDCYTSRYGTDEFELVCQRQGMKEEEREGFLRRFEDADMGEQPGALVGFCVLGGIFSEGIDLRDDSLIGAIIVGTGLPQVGLQLDILKDHFDRTMEGGRGFDYAYRIPGMNKVLQAAGRVIRTDTDRGIILLLDTRFTYGEYRRMFPREWDNIRVGSRDVILKAIKEFW